VHAEQGGKHLTLQAARTPLLSDGGEAPEAVGAARHGGSPSDCSFRARAYRIGAQATIVTLTKPGGALRILSPRPRGIMGTRVPGPGRWRMGGEHGTSFAILENQF
jgi:hypothetical protein